MSLWKRFALGVVSVLNLLVVVCAIVCLFSRYGLLQGMVSLDEKIEKQSIEQIQKTYEEANDLPAKHPCVDGGGPATQAVHYGNPPIVRWYCDPNSAPQFITVPSSSIPGIKQADAPINVVLRLAVVLANIYVLWFSISLVAHVMTHTPMPTVMDGSGG